MRTILKHETIQRNGTMTVKKTTLWILLFLAVATLLACAGMQGGFAPPLQHPLEEGENYRICTDCHDAQDETFPYRRFVHTTSFSANHRQVAYQGQQACFMCHAQSYCNDCHGVWVELKPSIKNQTDNRRWFPHRGDYITRHVIDARIDPTPCYRCHGNPSTARTCRKCHG